MNDIAKAIEWGKSYIKKQSYIQDFNQCDMKTLIAIAEKQLTNGWIPTIERLPENKVNVLMSKVSGTVRVGFCNVNYNEWREDGYMIPQPIAW